MPRPAQITFAILFCALAAIAAQADDLRNEPLQKDTLQAVLDRIHKHAASEEWKKEGFKDEEIEKWLDKAVGSITTAAGSSNVKLPVRLADIKPANAANAQRVDGQLIVGRDVNLPLVRLEKSVVLADGNVDVYSATRSVIIARGVVTVHGYSLTAVIVSGVSVIVIQGDGLPDAGGSVIISRGWAELRSKGCGTIISAREGIAAKRTDGAIFVNAPVPAQEQALRPVREPSRTIRVQDLPLESLPKHPLSSKIEVLGVMHAEVKSPGFLGNFHSEIKPVTLVFRHEGRRYIADIGQPIVDEKETRSEALGDWKVSYIAKDFAVLSRPDADAIVSVGAKKAPNQKGE